MHPFRFSILQLLLVATLVALVLGLVTSAWRASNYQSIEQVCFSPGGQYLAARYSGGAVEVWRLDASRPRLTARAFGRQGLFDVQFSSIHFVADDKLLKIDSQMFPTGGVKVRQLDLNTRQISDAIEIHPSSALDYAHAATSERLVLADWNTSSVAIYRLKTGRLERKWVLPTPPMWHVAISANGKRLAVCGQNGQIHVIDAEDDGPPVEINGIAPLALSGDGRFIATSSPDQVATVYVRDLTAGDEADQVKLDLMTVKAISFTSDNAHLLVSDPTKIDEYDLTTKKRSRRSEINDPAPGSAESCVLSPAGDRQANYSGSRIVLYDLSRGNLRHVLGGDSRVAEIAIFTLGFALWSVAWGVIAKRERLRQPRAAMTPLPALTPVQARPLPQAVAWQRQLVWIVATIAASLVALASLEIAGGQQIADVLLNMVGISTLFLGGILLFLVVYSWVAFLVVGPHYLTLVRLRRIAGDAGRLVRCGRWTFWFVGNSRLEQDYLRHAGEIIDNAEAQFGRAVEPRQLRLIACLDRQCDLNAFFGRPIPIAAVIPRYSIDRVTLVCEETAVMQLLPPHSALRSGLAFSILVEQQRGFSTGWVATLMIQQIARDERRPAELRGAVRRLKALVRREPSWDPRPIFTRKPRERLRLWLAMDEPQAWRDVRAETDLLLTVGEMLLHSGSPHREKVLAWLRGIRPKDDALETLTQQTGLTLDSLVQQWRGWLAIQSGLPYDPLPADSRWLLTDVAVPVIENSARPLKLRQRMIRQLGTFNVAGAKVLMGVLDDPKIELRREAIDALERMSGEAWGDDAARWQAWWNSLPAAVRDESDVPSFGRMVAAAVVGDAAAAGAANEPSESDAPVAIPQELKVCWALMVCSGLVALVIPIGLCFVAGPIVYPMAYYSLLVGVAAIARGAAGDTVGLPRIAGMQMANLMMCDLINLLVGWIERLLLLRPHVRQYLLRTNGGRL